MLKLAEIDSKMSTLEEQVNNIGDVVTKSEPNSNKQQSLFETE
jgi:hypothetical protein